MEETEFEREWGMALGKKSNGTLVAIIWRFTAAIKISRGGRVGDVVRTVWCKRSEMSIGPAGQGERRRRDQREWSRGY